MLDAPIQRQVLELLLELQEELGLSYLFISHDLAVAQFMDDRVAVMHKGQIVEEGTVDQVVNAPAHPYTRALLASYGRN
jgi:ABC-type oligopeptide transport system ATPase subunit